MGCNMLLSKICKEKRLCLQEDKDSDLNHTIINSKISISCFLEDIDLLQKLKKNSLDCSFRLFFVLCRHLFMFMIACGLKFVLGGNR